MSSTIVSFYMASGWTPVLSKAAYEFHSTWHLDAPRYWANTNWAKVCLNQQPHDGNIQNDVRMDLLGKISDRDRVVPFARRFPFFVTSRLERRSRDSLLTQLARFTPRLKSGFSEAAIELLLKILIARLGIQYTVSKTLNSLTHP